MRHLYGTLLGVILLVGCSAQPTTPNYPSGKTWMAGEEPSRDRNPASASIEGAIDARMLRYPDISDRHIVFVYAGDIWIAPRAGGDARRLTTAKGEEAFPRFSPDGNEIAFTGNYDGNEDAYIMPITGGIPRRLTYHPAEDRVNDWTPDGRSVLIASARDGGIEKGTQLYSISTQGGLAEKLPVPYGAFGTIAPGGSILAYVPITNDFRTWKRYRGGNTSDIWIFNLEKLTSRVLVRENANSSQPMWHGDSLYFVSDRDDNKRNNIWRCDVASGSFTQVTKFETMDVRFPAIGGDSIVFECGGKLNILDLKTSKYEEVSIRVLTDHITLKPRIENVSKLAGDVDVSPSAKRFVVAARGDIFSMPKEHGVTLNLTQTSGIAERTPAISPDGKTVAYFTDRTGEYELALRPLEGRGEERILTKLGPGFRYYPQWSPDSKKIVFIDQIMQVWVHDVEAGTTTKVDQCLSKYEGELRAFEVSWSADSRWFAYATEATNTYEAIFIYDTAENKLRQVTSAYYNDSSPAFDPDGKYLYYISKREFGRPLYSDIDHTWVYTNMRRIIAVPLRDDVPSPIAPRNDSELDKKKSEGDGESEGDGADEKESRMREASTNSDLQRRERPRRPDAAEETEGKAEEEEDTPVKRKPPKPVEIAFDDFERRGVVLPPEVNNYSALKAVSGKVLYIKQSTAGYSDDDEESRRRAWLRYCRRWKAHPRLQPQEPRPDQTPAQRQGRTHPRLQEPRSDG
ncbi:MAG: hypothetical protein L6Q71_03550 [Planctomycetes bacterium]|nr:hypothetical protein [Planctomycetota bacterium]